MIELNVTEDAPIVLDVESSPRVRMTIDEQIINQGGAGLSDEVKQTLLAVIQNVAYTTPNGQDYYDALYAALYPPIELDYITAVYTQSGTVYDTDSLDSLKADLVVTAYYDDGTSAPVTAYTLSGTLEVGTSTITVSYGGKTDTFSVTVTHMLAPLYNWDFTQSLTDTVEGMTATLKGGAARGDSGLQFTAANQCAILTNAKKTIADRTVIIDIPTSSLVASGSNHSRLFSSSSNGDGNTGTSTACFTWRYNYGWDVYSGSTWGTAWSSSTYPLNFFSGKRLKIYVGSDMKLTVSYAEIGSDEFTEIGTFSTAWQSTYETGYLVLGGYNNNALSAITISKCAIYEGEV